MPRSDEAEMWYTAVYQAIQQVPHGRVTSYGHIATLLGYRKKWVEDRFDRLLTPNCDSGKTSVSRQAIDFLQAS